MLSETKSAGGGTNIVSIGAATVDIFVKSEEFDVARDVLTLPYSAKTEISQSLITSGGGATNSSVSFSRLDLKSACLSLLGTDPLSQYIVRDLNSNHVDTSLLVENSTDVTDFSVILVAPDGGRTILTNRGNTRLESDQIDWKKLELFSWFYITSLEGNLDLLEQLVGFAQEHAIRISLNPGNRELAESSRLIPLLKYVDFLLLNRTESEKLTSLSFDDHSFWPKLTSYGSKIVSVTNGRDGAYVYSGTENFYSPIINTTPVDETGAGDSFGSAFVSGIIHNLSPSHCLEWGVKNSASVVSQLSAKAGLLTLSQIK